MASLDLLPRVIEEFFWIAKEDLLPVDILPPVTEKADVSLVKVDVIPS